MRGAAGFLANPARLLRWDGFGAQRVAEPVGASAELGEPTRPRAKSLGSCPRAPGDRHAPPRFWRRAGNRPGGTSSRAGEPRAERATTTLVDHVEVPFSQGIAVSSPTSLRQPPAGQARGDERAQEQQRPPRAREPPGRGERQAPNRVPPPPTGLPSLSERPARSRSPRPREPQRWATSLRAWPATNQTPSRGWRRMAASREPQPASNRVLPPDPPFRSALGPSGRTVGARADTPPRLGLRSSANGGAVTNRRRGVGRRLPVAPPRPASGSLSPKSGRHSATSDLT